jgi:hypothetical protein
MVNRPVRAACARAGLSSGIPMKPAGAVERWLDKKGLAESYSCSVRSIENAMSAGLPHLRIFGRAKFRVSETDRWLFEKGYIERLDDGCTVVTGSCKWGGTAPTARPRHRRG